MANQKELDAHYSTIDKIFRLSLGEKSAYSCARFNGNFSMTLEEAQLNNYRSIAAGCNIGKGTKVLDLGCGWGGFLDYLNQQGAETYGVALAKAQVDACIRNGLNVRLMDSKDITPETFGKFNALTAIGSPEHLCSVEEYQAGQQEKIYRKYFKQAADLLPVGGRFYCQTMVFGPNMVRFEDIPFYKTNLWKKEFTNEELMDIICRVFPGSWLPYGKEGIIGPALEHFHVVSIESGRTDYIETMKRWSAAFVKFNFKKYWLYTSYLPSYLYSEPVREWVRRFQIQANRLLFEREVFEHYRIVLEKVKD